MNNFLRRLMFRLWYLFNPPWDTGISPPELIDFIGKHPPGNAIDIGCGTGTNVITLSQAGWQVTGVDFVPRAIKTAERKVKNAGIEAKLFVRDATNLEGISGPFDLALDIGCYHTLGASKADYLTELERILAPDGHWLMYGFFSSDQSGPGLAEGDLDKIPSSMTQVWRENGTDRGDRASAWFLYQKKSDNEI
jgi:ubiquinone/menaquinone biosynthesis C-methylase UbiE